MNLGHPLPPRALHAPRLLALGGAWLWGALECIALWRSRWARHTTPR